MQHCDGAIELRLSRRAARNREADSAEPFLVGPRRGLIEQRDQHHGEDAPCDVSACHEKPRSKDVRAG